MNTQNTNKIQKLLKHYTSGSVILSATLRKLGISNDLQQYYRKSGILKTVGRGAFVLPNEEFDIFGAIYALQKQAELQIHIGGLSALSLQGFSHYARFDKPTMYLFSTQKKPLPNWFVKHNWQYTIFPKYTNKFPIQLGFVELDRGYLKIKCSSPERAILELLYLVPNFSDMVEAYQIMEGLVNLRPNVLQSLLAGCSCIKVKRLFLFMAERAGHSWFKRLDLKQITLGAGIHKIAQKGKYNNKYQITVAKELL